jgi:Cu+-exporting ATPase
MAKQSDPVCGMPVEEGRAAGTSEYEGRTYYFCSYGCREKFSENPRRYARREARERANDGARSRAL